MKKQNLGIGLLLMGLLLFAPAGTLVYPEGWRFMAILFVPMILAGFVMIAKCPALLRKRLNMKEKLGEQKQVILMSCLMFLFGFAAAGLSFRFGFMLLPEWVSWAACAAFLLAYALYALVLRQWAGIDASMPLLALYGLVGCAVTELGDLAFSLIKRQHGVKDYGHLMPGHGGMMDRFDSTVFAAPTILLLVELFPAF